MRGLGRLAAMLNPLDQSMAQQIMKSTMGKGMFERGIAFAKAGASQVLKGGYFRGINAAGEGMGMQGSNFIRAGGTAMLRREAASTRMAIGGIGAAWAGLNIMSPSSSLTTAANYGMLGAGALAAGPSVQSKWGNAARNTMYAGVGGTLGAKMLGVF